MKNQKPCPGKKFFLYFFLEIFNRVKCILGQLCSIRNLKIHRYFIIQNVSTYRSMNVFNDFDLGTNYVMQRALT